MNKGSLNEDLIVSLPCSGLCLHSPLPSTEQGVVGESGVQNSTYAPPPPRIWFISIQTSSCLMGHILSDGSLHFLKCTLNSLLPPDLSCSLILSQRPSSSLFISWKKISSIIQHWGFRELSRCCQTNISLRHAFCVIHWFFCYECNDN